MTNRNNLFTIILLFALFLTAGCSSTRYLQPDQVMVTKVKLKNIDDRFEEQANTYVQRDLRPASLINLRLYNLLNVKHGKYRTDKIRKLGQAPAILDSSLVEISRTQIEKFLHTKGFFRAKVKSDIQIKGQKARVVFTAIPGQEYVIRDFKTDIPDTSLAGLYAKYRPSFTHIHPQSRFDADSLSYEREQIYQLMRKNGYFEFLRQYVRVGVDTTAKANRADLKMSILNPVAEEKHPVFKINNSSLTIRNSDGSISGTKADSTVLGSQFYLKDYSGRFKLKPISPYFFIKKGNLYNLESENLTYDRLYELNVFKNIKISYEQTADSSKTLNVLYDFTPLKKMANRIEGEYTFNAARYGFNIANTYTNRNLFGGAEQLDVRFRYGMLFDSKQISQLSDRAFNRDFEIRANLSFPRILTPFRNSVSGKNGIPHTTISSGFQFFRQKDAFTNRSFLNSYTYDWLETRYKKHTFTPISLEYRKGEFDPAFRQKLLDEGYVLYVKTNDRQFVNFGSQYTFTYNNVRLNSKDNFIYFRSALDLSGNTLGLLSKTLNLKTVGDQRTIFGLSYLQYAKAELDVRWYQHFGGDKQLVVRINPGVGIPYGNSESLPIEKSFYAGGTSGVRAWQARTLGPGKYNRADIDPDIRKNLRNLDQLGEIKLEANLEYRFKLINNLFGAKVKGAAFTDVGNIWRVKPAADNPGGEFKANTFLKQLAIGAGAGLRFDMDYFIFRLDAAVKIRDPQFVGADQWVIKKMFNKEFKQNYATTHYPDVYRFVQYNFGIGMPF
ncbi:MAG: BamA/TamA family outer membrane protein [Sphingobacteriaceae bacterium]